MSLEKIKIKERMKNMGSLLKSFIAYLLAQEANHSIYVWGGQGQDASVISNAWIQKMETDPTNASRAIAFWEKQKAAGYGVRLRAFDCSGLGVYWLLAKGLIDGDKTADGLRRLCEKVNVPKAGDFVFRVKNGSAYHIGYVVDDTLDVVEAKGRDDGVCRTRDLAQNTGYWDECRRPPFWGSDYTAPTFHISKNLKRGMDDAEVMHVTRNLTALGYMDRDCTSVFDVEVEKAVKAFQADCKAKGTYTGKIDGEFGELSTIALGGKWVGK